MLPVNSIRDNNEKDSPEKTGKSGKKTKTQPKQRSFLSTFFWAVMLTISVTLLGAAIALILYLQPLIESLPTMDQVANFKPSLSSYIYDAKGRIIATLFLENRKWVKLNEISEPLKRSIIAAEDSDFYTHHGISLKAIFRALVNNLTSDEGLQGGSTITQQTTRNMFLSKEKTLQRKIREAILALRLEQSFTKDEILEFYLNQVYFGHGAYGVYAASKTYFNKEPKDIDWSEATLIAGVLPAPEYYSPIKSPENAKNRQDYVAKRLLELGWITDDEAQRIIHESIKLDFHQTGQEAQVGKAPYFVRYLLFKQLLPKYGTDLIYRGGLKIYTTLDLDIQTAAEESIKDLKPQGAIICLDPQTGAIKAMVGGKSFEESKFNRAIQAYREPGSAFKVFVYTAAVENGFRPIDHVIDEKISYTNGWTPSNYDEKFHGEVTLMEALRFSYNIAAIKVLEAVGTSKTVALAKRMGITSPYLAENLSLALGTSSVTPIEITAAFCAFANGGYRVSPFSISHIENPQGEIFFKDGAKLERAIDEDTAYVMLDMLKQVVDGGTGTRAKIKGYEVFGKTGTTNEFGDAWFIGGTPGLVAAVFAGNDDHKSLGKKASGGVVAAPVWNSFMTKALASYTSPTKFPIPAGVSKIKVCKQTGFLASPSCPPIYVALKEGTEPTDLCPLHSGSGREVMICPDSGLLASPGCPNPQKMLLLNDQVPLQYCNIHGTGMPLIPETTPKPNDLPVTPSKDQKKTPEQDVEQRIKDLLKEYGIDPD